MSKRVNNRKGAPSSNRGGRNNRYNRYMQQLDDAKQAAASEDVLEEIKKAYVAIKSTATKFVPKGASKMLASLVRQRG